MTENLNIKSRNKIKVFIIDDSAVVRQTLTDILSSNREIEVIGVASNPVIAAKKLEKDFPDVIVLDLEMPQMDGITFLKKIMKEYPVPVVICSSKAEEGSTNALQVLEYGAIDIIHKPKLGTKLFLEESRVLISDVIIAAYLSGRKIKNKKKNIQVLLNKDVEYRVNPKLSADVILPKPRRPINLETTEKVIVVGASTGGTEAIRIFLEAMPIDSPGIVIVQHMPEKFTTAFSRRLDSICKISVKEAENNDTVLRGRALIAPGNYHTLLKRSGARYYVEVREGPLVCRHRPSVDVLFRSTARYAGKNAVGVIMTGMGDDGAMAMKEMHDAGSYNIAQDEKSCIVFGMPKEAIKKGGINEILSLNRIAEAVLRRCNM
jgi:two-component system, chemotaxis family, protein-glutamate methylesterase/glutaminase